MEFLAGFGMAMLPIWGIKEDYALGIALGLPIWIAYVLVVVGNLLPVPFLLVLLKEGAGYLRRFDCYIRVTTTVDNRMRIGRRFNITYTDILLLLLMVLPFALPGVWIGAVLAIAFQMNIKKAFLIIMTGTVIAGMIAVMMLGNFANM